MELKSDWRFFVVVAVLLFVALYFGFKKASLLGAFLFAFFVMAGLAWKHEWVSNAKTRVFRKVDGQDRKVVMAELFFLTGAVTGGTGFAMDHFFGNTFLLDVVGFVFLLLGFLFLLVWEKTMRRPVEEYRISPKLRSLFSQGNSNDNQSNQLTEEQKD